MASSIFLRIKTLLPLRAWFTDDTPVLDALLHGMASGLQYAKEVFDYAKLQTRIRTATDGWLDLIAWDFFGSALLRRKGQGDDSFRAAILTALFREKVTRKGLHDVLYDITGQEPRIFEPQRPLDTGAWGIYGGYGVTGGYGSYLHPAEVMVTAFRPQETGIPNIAGYNVPTGAYSVPSQAVYADGSTLLISQQDLALYSALDQTKAAGITVWACLTQASQE